jgi:hypothetical protein
MAKAARTSRRKSVAGKRVSTARRTSTRTARRTAGTRKAAARKGRRWSARVTRTSDALTLDDKVFTRTPDQIARSLKRSAERSNRRKSGSFQSAMSMLTFYINRAGRNLPAARKKKLQRAKQSLRELYDRV